MTWASHPVLSASPFINLSSTASDCLKRILTAYDSTISSHMLGPPSIVFLMHACDVQAGYDVQAGCVCVIEPSIPDNQSLEPSCD